VGLGRGGRAGSRRGCGATGGPIVTRPPKANSYHPPIPITFLSPRESRLRQHEAEIGNYLKNVSSLLWRKSLGRMKISIRVRDRKRMHLEEEENGHSTKTFAIESEDIIVERLIYQVLGKPHGETGVYVDIGAYDPIRASNTYRFYKRGWRGLNIEPNPAAIPRFREIRPRDTTINIGVAATRGTLVYTSFTDPALNGFLEDKWVDRHVRMGTSKVVSRTPVRVAPAREIFDEYLRGEPSIDMLNIDVELLEMEVLSSIDFKSFRPKVIVIELHGPVHELDTTKKIPNFDIETIGQTREANLLKANGYAFFSRICHSSIFVDRKLL